MRNQLILLSALFVFAACTKEKYSSDPIPNPFSYSVTTSGNIVTVRNLPADTIIGMTAQGQPFGAGKYSFFSLESGQWIPNSDSNSNRWDLAFAGTTVRVNNVTSGPAGGGAFVFNGTFESLTAVPVDSTFRVDNHPISYAIPRGSGRAWYTYDGPTNLLTPIPGRTLVIRTATGKTAKVEILNYYRGGVTPSAAAPDSVKIRDQRFFHFRYSKF